MLQVFISDQNYLAQNAAQNDLIINLVLAWVVILLIVGVLFILRSLARNFFRAHKAFDRVVLCIQVPKERKSEGTNQQGNNEDRLEHVKEEIGITETLFATVAGLKTEKGFDAWFKGRNDHMAFELVVHNNQISFYVAVPAKRRSFIEQQINAQYPYAQIEEMIDYNIFQPNSRIVGAYLKNKNPQVFPFRTYKKMDSDPLSSVLNVLSKINEHNSSAAVQFIIRSADKKWRRRGVRIVREVRKGEKFENVAHRVGIHRFFHLFGKFFGETFRSGKTPETKLYQLSPMEEEMLKGIEEKLSKGGLQVTIRAISSSDDKEIAQMNLDNIINSFSQFNFYRYGNEFNAVMPRNQKKLISDFIYRSFHESRSFVLNTEEIAGMWHLPLHSTEAPNIKWLTGRKAAPPSNLPKSGLLLGHILYRGVDQPIYMKEADRRRHLYVIGKSGTGKSVFISNLVKQDIRDGKGVCVIDPHGDLVEDILGDVPKHRADEVIVFNPSDMERPIGLNMLEAKTEDQKDFAVQEMISIFYKLFPPEMIGPMFEHQMRNVMLTLMADIHDTGTIIDIPRMFTDNDFVKKYLVKLKDPVVRAFWEKEMAKTSDFHKSEMLGYLISKVGRFVENEMMRNIMGQQKSGFDFRDIMDNQKILLVNLSKGTTGEVNSQLLGLIIVAKLQMAAMGRANLPESERKDFYLYIDEFQNFVTNSIATILSEARKYRLDLIIAHQYMGQLMDDKGRSEIKDAVLGNAGTICTGRIGPDDADILQKEFAPVFGAYDLLNPPPFSYYTKLLIDNEAAKPFSMLGYPPHAGNPELAAAIKQLSRLKYGRDRRIVETEILERTQLGMAAKGAKDDMIEASL
ncbi:MAG: type IV secretion system DNA-binding domain-containing protein [Patescibacteria group bacterium]